MPGILLGTDPFGRDITFPESSRKFHLHLLGAPGRGKSKFLEHLIRHDITNKHGLCLIDPHGGLYNDVIAWCVWNGMLSRRKIILIEPSDEKWTCGFNPLDFSGFTPAEQADAVEGMVRACAQVWGGEDLSKTPRLARILPSVFHALAANKLTLLEALDLCDAYNTDGLRKFLTSDLDDRVFREEWEQFNRWEPSQFTDLFESTRNRLAAFLRSPVVRSMLGLGNPSLDLSRAMEEGAIVLVNLGGKLSHENRRLVGALLVNALFMKALRRPPERCRPFYLYLDECYYFFNDDISRILTEGRKFGLHAVLAHQNLGQLRQAGDAVYTAVMQIENKVVFGGVRPPADAAEVAETLFTGELDFEEPKAVLNKPTVVGYVREWLESQSEGRGAGVSTGASSALVASTMSPEEGGIVMVGDGMSSADFSGESAFSSSSSGRHEALIPQFEYLPTSVYSLQEQIHRAMATMVNQPTQHAVVKLYGNQTVTVRTPDIPESIASSSRVVSFKKRAFERAECVIPAREAEERINARHEKLRKCASRDRREPKSYFES